jgi:glycosyltransferase involved in cell wall biosynthesis
MRLLFVTQKLDADDPVLGFVGDWVRALGERFDEMTVIANEVREVPGDLGVPVISLGAERGAERLVRGLRYLRTVAKLTRGGSVDVLIAHMCPVYLNLAWPLLRRRGVRPVLWFAHPSVTPALRMANQLADTILTSLPGAYPLPGPKVRVIGQAVDLEDFPFSPRRRDGVLRLVAVGRTSPAKGFPVIVRAVAAARESGIDVRLRIIGPSTTTEEIRHRTELESLVREYLSEAGALESGIPHSQIPATLGEADALVNAMVAGSGDKVVFEAAALGRPVLVSNPAFHGLLRDLPIQLTYREGDDRALAARIAELASAEPASWSVTVKELRSRVEREHSLDHWADGVASARSSR